MADRVDPNTGRIVKPGTRRVASTAEYAGPAIERKNRASEKPKDFNSPAPLPAPGTPEFTAWASQPQKDTSGQVSGLSSYTNKPRDASAGSTAGKISLDEHSDATAREVSASAAAKADMASDPDFAPTATEKATKSPTTSNGGEHSEYAGLGKLLGSHFAGGYRHPGDPEASRNLMADAVPAMSSKPSKEEKTSNASALSARNASLPVNSAKVNKPYADHFNEQVAAHDAAQAPTETPVSAAKPKTTAGASPAADNDWMNQPGEAAKIASVEDIDKMSPITDTHAKKLDKLSADSKSGAVAEPIKFSSYEDVASKNNMGAPRTQDNGASAVSGRTSTDSQTERDNARKAARTGTRGGGKAAEDAAAARPVNRRSAASAAPTPAPVTGPQFSASGGKMNSRRHAEGFAAMVTPEGGPSSKLSDKPTAQPPVKMADSAGHQAQKTVSDMPAPVSNSAPVSPTPNANNFAASPAAQQRAPLRHGEVGISKPTVGEVTRAINNPKAPASKMREGYNSHIAGGGNDSTYWAGRDSAKAKRDGAKSAKATPKAAVVEQPSLAPAAKKESPAPVAKTVPAAAPTPVAPTAAAKTAPARSRIHQSTGDVASSVGRSVGNVNRTPYGEHNDFSGARNSIAQRTPMSSQMGMAETPGPAPASPARSRRAPAAPATAGPAVTPSGPTGGGRTGSAPRGEVGGGRGSFGGGEHSVNVGGDNSGHITINHNTNNINYGTNSGSMGNMDHGGSRGSARPSGGGGGGGGGDHEPAQHGGGGQKFNAWYHDSSGTHDLRRGIDHVTGKTGGHGENLSGSAPSTSAGGKQKPLKGSARASGGQQGQAQQNPTGTGSTSNWQGPQNTHTASASGNGTAQKIPTP